VLPCSGGNSFVNNMVKGLLAAVDEFGFQGIDFDIEHRSGDYIACGAMMASALEQLKAERPGLMLTMAPQMGNVDPFFSKIEAGTNELVPVISKAMNCMDWIQPQMYNTWAAVETTSYAKDYVGALIRGFQIDQEYSVKLAASQIILGYPSSRSGASSGYIDPSEIVSLVSQLRAEGYNIRGLMTWSIGWDQEQGYAFAKAIKSLDDSVIDMAHSSFLTPNSAYGSTKAEKFS